MNALFLDPVAFSLFGLPVRWYGLMYFIGILLAWVYMRRTAKLFPFFSQQELDDAIPWLVGGIVVGGRLGYVLFYQPALIFENPLAILKTWEGGMSFHGGLLGVLAALIIYAKKNNVVPSSLFDVMACGTPIGLFFGRIGNFINQEAWGRVTEVPWGVVFPKVDAYARHPSQLYEAGLEGILLFLVLWWLRRVLCGIPWALGFTFLLGYGALRWVAELYRVPDAFFVWGNHLVITEGQLLSLPMIVAGLFFFWWRFRRPL